MDQLAMKFQQELVDKMYRAKKECNYNPTRFNQMLARYGAIDTAKRLINESIRTGNPSDGFTTLFLCGRLDLTMEDSVCDPQYAGFFSKEEIAQCKRLLGRAYERTV